MVFQLKPAILNFLKNPSVTVVTATLWDLKMFSKQPSGKLVYLNSQPNVNLFVNNISLNLLSYLSVKIELCVMNIIFTIQTLEIYSLKKKRYKKHARPSRKLWNVIVTCGCEHEYLCVSASSRACVR